MPFFLISSEGRRRRFSLHFISWFRIKTVLSHIYLLPGAACLSPEQQPSRVSCVIVVDVLIKPIRRRGWRLSRGLNAPPLLVCVLCRCVRGRSWSTPRGEAWWTRRPWRRRSKRGGYAEPRWTFTRRSPSGRKIDSQETERKVQTNRQEGGS